MTKNMTNNEKVSMIRSQIQDAIDATEELESSRVKAITITKLEEAQMWIGNLFSKDKTDGLIKRG